MKFIAKLKPRTDANVTLLIKEFFASSPDKGSAISIKDGEVHLTVGFEESPPKNILDAIENYEVIEFFFKVDNINEKETESQNSFNAKEEMTQKAAITSTAESQEDKNIKPASKGKTIEKLDEIPEVKEMLQSSKSFEEFLNKVSEWLKLKEGKTLENFVKAVIVPAKDDKKTTWKTILANVENTEMACAPETARIKYTVAVSEKMKEEGYETSPIKFIKMLSEYANCWDDKDKNEKENNNVEADKVETNNNSAVSTDLSLRDEEPIKKLFVSLMDVAQNGKISVRTENVFKRMGLKEKDRDLLEIADIALKFPAEQLTWEEILKCLKNSFPTEGDRMNAQRRMSGLINVYANKLGLGKIKSIDFLTEMKKVILSNLD